MSNYRAPMATQDGGVAFPRVSVLMPVYNTAAFLEEALRSIADQTFTSFEFIIVDDGSNDGSAQILAAFERKDHRVRVLSNVTNMGIVHSLNRGIKECRGDYIFRMDSDDISMSDRIEQQIAVLDANPKIVVLGSSLTYIEASGRELGIVRQSRMGRSLLFMNPLFHPTVVFRRTALEENGNSYLERYRYAEDYYLWMQLSKIGELSAIDQVLLKYRISDNVSRIKHLKAMLRATLRVKLAGALRLGLRPSIVDIVRFALECFLLFLPNRLVLWIYTKTTFGNKAGIT
jgi:glycosyltransferase involved in cell wall biosynthesis